MTHLVLNATLAVLYSVNVWIRTVLGPVAVLPLLLSVVGVAGLMATLRESEEVEMDGTTGQVRRLEVPA